jgi:hypothetical protein
MSAGRTGHTATLLPDGRVLVAGGNGDATAEVYDPATGNWTPAGTMRDERFHATATLLDSGRVLVTGGRDGANDPVQTTDIYDPATNTWSPGPDLDAPRVEHNASLLPDGRVLITGGSGTVGTLLYDPARNAFDSGPPLPFVEAQQTSTALPNGDVLLAGSSPRHGLRYRYSTGKWVSAGAATLPDRTDYGIAELPDGRVLMAGGYDGIRWSDAWLWTPPTTSIGDLAPVDFGAVYAPSDRTVTLRNSGSEDDLLIDDLEVTGGAFSLVSDGCSPDAVAPGGQCAVTVRFTPPASGSADGALNFTFNGEPAAQSVALHGAAGPIKGGPPPLQTPPSTPPSTQRPPTAHKPPHPRTVRIGIKVKGRISGRSRCHGSATIRLYAGKKRVARARVHLTSKCRFKRTVKVSAKRVGRHKRLKVNVRYAGHTTRIKAKVPRK